MTVDRAEAPRLPGRGRVLVLRHGQSTWNLEGRWQGWANPPLTELGREQARRVAAALAADGPALSGVWSSDLQRAWQTAQLLADGLGLGPVHAASALREVGLGPWEGLTRAEIDAGWPGDVESHRRPPGAELIAVATKRIVTALGEVARTPGPSLVVTHAGVIRLLCGAAEAEWRPFANLAGRWFDVELDTGVIHAGVRVDLLAGSSR